jgi:Transposase DDE domain group 1
MRLLRSHPPLEEGTLRVQATRTRSRFEVTCDGDGIAGHAGAALLGVLADRLGLTAALGWRAGRGQTPRHRHAAGAVLRDLAVLLADGGDALSDLAVLRNQPELFGVVASTPTAWRVIEQVAGDPDGLAGLRAARAHARAAAWQAGAHAEGVLVVDVDGTLVDAHSPKQGAAGTYKGGFGFYPLVCFLDRGDGTGEALSGILRPGNAGSNTASDHIEVVDLALAQLPRAARAQPLLVRADTGGATHALLDHLRQRGVRFSVSLPADERVRAAVLAVPADAWQPAVDAGGQPRPGAEVAELHALDLASWPTGTRAICRREDPHPGAQLSFTDADGHRFQVFITDQPDPDVATLELRHRRRARVEDRIRCGKATGLRNLPFDRWRRNQVWLELVLAAQDLTCWAQVLLLDGDLKVAEPKTLRYRLWHVAARVVRHARRIIVRLQHSWPWATELAAAFTRLRVLPLRC